MAFSPDRLEAYLPGLPSTGKWWIALSGGLDSCVLLHALASLSLPVSLHALHINHQISPNACEWEVHCAKLCAGLGIPFTAVRVNVQSSGRGLEDAAREARYTVFKQYLGAGDYLLTAHHADDQTETMLLRLMRGAGPRGLAAMARQRPLALGILHRPLLGFTRADLEDYAQRHQLVWVDDESNGNDYYDRNYLRNQVMPLLRGRWPAFAQKWQETAELCAANEALVAELAGQDLSMAGLKNALVGTHISLEYLKQLTSVRRHNLLRLWLRGQGLAAPDQQHLNQIELQIVQRRQDAETQVGWGNVSLRIYRERAYALPVADIPRVPKVQPTFSPVIDLPAGFRLCCQLTGAGAGLRADLVDLHVRFRQGGERCRPAGRRHSQTLKRLLQEYGIEPWLRESLPLVYSGDILVAVADLWVCEGYQADTGGYCLKYERIPEDLK